MLTQGNNLKHIVNVTEEKIRYLINGNNNGPTLTARVIFGHFDELCGHGRAPTRAVVFVVDVCCSCFIDSQQVLLRGFQTRTFASLQAHV